MLGVLDLFSGIGGFSLGLERTGGFKTVAFCEINPYCRRVLAKHWPEVPCFEDVRDIGPADIARLGRIDVVCAGFPCQDIANAGPGGGLDGPRSGLWREIPRILKLATPRFALIENSADIRSRGLGQVLKDLWALGFDAEWHVIPASAVGAPHRRDRIWIAAYANGERCDKRAGAGSVRAGWQELADGHRWQPEPEVGRVVHGLPGRVDRVSALGNAVVPVIPELIGRAILAANNPE